MRLRPATVRAIIYTSEVKVQGSLMRLIKVLLMFKKD
jgi:hypothetical protein